MTDETDPLIEWAEELDARRLLLTGFSSALHELINQGETRVTVTADAKALNDAINNAARKPQTFEEAQRLAEQATYHLLVQLGGKKITDQSGISYHDGTAINLPTDPQTMSKAEAAKILAAAAKNEEMEHAYSRVFKYRPWDGANALQLALKKVFGTSGEGAMQMTMFGPQPPEKIQIEVGVGKEISVPWGNINFPLLDAVIQTGITRDHQYGELFRLKITAPKKHGAAIEGLFVAIEQELKENSIYRGKAFVGVEKPMFIDPYKIQRNKVVYAEEVFTRLENSIWGPIRTAALQEKEGLALNVKAVLHGPYGTGKSLALGLTAQTAIENGWTFIQCTTGKDNLTQVMQTAALYAPCVVGIEDIDVLAQAGNEEDNSKLLELFDGIAVKNNKVMVVMTSNRAAEMHKGMLRAGRIDAAIEIGPLDEKGVERLIKVSIPEGKLSTKIDWPAVHEAMKGYEPAFIKETFVSAQRAAIVRSESLNYRLETADFVAAALLLKPQHDLHDNAKEKGEGLTIDDLIQTRVSESLQNHKVDTDNDWTLIEVEKD